MTPELSLIVPCFNEAEHLLDSVAAIRRILDARGYDYEIVFVDDDSEDQTRALLVQLCAGQTRDRFIFHEQNRGRGAAVKTGFAQSSGRVTGFLDIDLEIAAAYLPALVDAILVDGYDVAIARRAYAASSLDALRRHAVSLSYRLLLRASLDCGVSDTEAGCKFFRRETAQGVVLGSASDGWFWDTEVMSRAALSGLSIREVPVLFRRRSDKRSTVRVLPDSFRYLLALRAFRAKVGMSLSAKSPIYWTARGYDSVMRLLYGQAYGETYASVARRIPDDASVVDLCCGSVRLARDHFVDRPVTYVGLDFNGHFVMAARRQGVDARFFDVLHESIPSADFVVMCSSLYHFRSHEDELLNKLRAAARVAVLLSEPVHNVASSSVPFVARMAKYLSDPGVGEAGQRYDVPSLRRMAARHGALEVVHEPGQRNALIVLPGAAAVGYSSAAAGVGR